MRVQEIIRAMPSPSGNTAIDLAILAIASMVAYKAFGTLFTILRNNSDKQTKRRDLRKTLELKARDLEALRASLATARAETSQEIERLHREQERQAAETAKKTEREHDPRFRDLEQQLAEAINRPRRR
ncbi:MAG: hypothetical protein ACK5Y6_05330 [Pseudomonadota bacterium]